MSAAMLGRAVLALSGAACVACATASPPLFFCPEGTSPASMRTTVSSDLPPVDTVLCRKPDGTPHGPFVRWIEGQLWAAGNHRDGRLQGSGFEWLDGGRRGGETEWDAGTMQRAIRWNADGVATYEMVRTGEAEVSTLRYEGGALRSKITWRGDEPDGPFEAWHESGQKRLEGRYERGERVGAWTCWDERGSALHARYDAAGELVGLDDEDAAKWRSCLRPIGHDEPAPAEVPAAIE
jgi:hypothetical protein